MNPQSRSRRPGQPARRGAAKRCPNRAPLLLAALALLTSCERDQPDRGAADPETVVERTELEPRIISSKLSDRVGATSDEPLFHAHDTQSTGVVGIGTRRVLERNAHLSHSPFAVGGSALADLDADGDLDLFLADGPGPNKLYVQTAPLVFEDRAAALGVDGGAAWGTGVAIADVEGDGDADIYVANYDGPNQLFLNDGTGRRFTESAAAVGLDASDASLMPSFADYDQDGDLDVFVLTYKFYRAEGRPSKPPTFQRDGEFHVVPELAKYYTVRQVGDRQIVDNYGRRDLLFRNDGGRYVEVGVEAGLDDLGYGLSATWWDYDADGDADLWVANDFVDADRLWENQGDGTFRDVAAETAPYTTWSSMGADCADLDGDGRLDLMVGDMAATTHFKAKITMGEMGTRRWFLENAWPRQTMRNAVYLSNGTSRLEEVAFIAGLAKTDWTWAVKLADFDNDGRTDVFVTNGMTRMLNDADHPVPVDQLIGRSEWDLWKSEPELIERNLAFRNAGDLRFDAVEDDWGIGHTGTSFASAYGDFGRDGDLDLVVVHLGAPPSIYENREADGHRVVIELQGRAPNRDAIGAELRLVGSSGRTWVKQLQPSTGYLSSNDPALVIGLGDETSIRQLEVRWPDGSLDEFHDLAVDHRHRIRQAAARDPTTRLKETRRRETRPEESSRPPRFTECARDLGIDRQHRENDFDDYARQPLLPARQSRFGPGIAVGDIDGDSRLDIWSGGAAGQLGTLLLQQEAGKFRAAPKSAAFEKHRSSEDQAAVFLDADSDGYLDLFVASGGAAGIAGHEVYRDRLYLGDGRGQLRDATESSLPSTRTSSSAVVAADFDQDGDLDLFVGSRAIPGQYPRAAPSRLLINRAGIFEDRSEDRAPALRSIGLVQSATGSDLDGDGDIDLTLALEWGPIACLENVDGHFKDRTAAWGFSERTGWWSSLVVADLDRDGDGDIVALNAGLNTKYGQPTSAKPSLLYAGDIEQKGVLRLVEAKHDIDGGLVPFRGKSCSTSAMPSLGTRFPSYRSFAAALLPEIYGQESLDGATRLTANCLESGWYRNDGPGRFVWQPLPRRAQLSPGQGAVALDSDGDGYVELHIAQNFYHREPETGLWRGSFGVTLRAREGQLSIVPPAETGFIVPGDARGLASADLDGDGWPDLLATQNDDRLLAFRNRGGTQPPVRVRLRGSRGNETAVGARVTLRLASGARPSADIRAGSGVLSQSSPDLWLAAGTERIEEVLVRWPDGARTSHELAKDSRSLLISREAGDAKSTHR